jgi:flagellar secretion chaperone FliS
MFGSPQAAIQKYTQTSMETGVIAATPVELIVMLYDGAIVACRSAIPLIEQRQIEKKSTLLSKAIMIIESGLRLSLNKKVGGEIAQNLDALYGYMSDRLYIANIRNQPEAVEEVIKLLVELKGAWEAIGRTRPVVAERNSVTSAMQAYAGY